MRHHARHGGVYVALQPLGKFLIALFAWLAGHEGTTAAQGQVTGFVVYVASGLVPAALNLSRFSVFGTLRPCVQPQGPFVP